MRTILLKLAVCSSVFFPISEVQAAGPMGKTYGGFTSGKKVTLTVSNVDSTKLENFVSKKSPVPAGIPKLKKGQKVKFVIGKKGELTFPGISLAFDEDNGTSNAYVDLKSKNFNANSADIFKDTKNNAAGAVLFLYKEKPGGLMPIPVVYTVKYTLKK